MSLIDSCISHDEFDLVNNLLREYRDIKKPQQFRKDINLYSKSSAVVLLKVQKNKECKNLRVAKTNRGNSMLLSKYALCDSKKLRFIKNKQGSGVVGNT